MSNITNDYNTLINNLSTQFDNVINNYNTSTNTNTNSYIKNSGDTISGILYINNIDSNNNINIGENASTITIGSLTNNDIKTINIGGLNDNINSNSNINMNSNKIINVSNGVNNNDGINLNQANTIITSKNLTKLSQLTNLNDSNINLNSYRLTNVSNGTNSNDAVTKIQINSVIPTKLSQLTTLNDANLNLNSYKITNVSNGTNSNDLVNKSQVTTLLNSNMPTKLSNLTTLNDADINLNSYKLINVANPVSSKDAMNYTSINTLITSSMTTKLSQLTTLNDSNVNINSYKLINVANGTNNNDAINLNQMNTLITTAKSSIPFSNINTFGSNINNVLLGNGTFGKVTNNQINDGTINLSKFLNYPNNSTKFLCGDGTYKTINVNSNTIGKFELFDSNITPPTGFIATGLFGVSSSTYPKLCKYIIVDYVYKNTITATINSSPAQVNFSFCNNLFIRSYTTGVYIYIDTSINGVTWTNRYMGTGSNLYYQFTYGNGYYVSHVNNNNWYYFRSSDGISWTQNSMLGATLGSKSIVYGNGRFVSPAFGAKYYTSTNGTTWSYLNLPVSDSWSYVDYNNNMFIIFGTTRTYLTSPDGLTWTQRTLPYINSSSTYTLLCKYGKNVQVVLVRSTNIAFYSYDNINWNKTYLTYATSWSHITFGNDIFLVTTDNSNSTTTLISDDGIIWTSSYVPLTYLNQNFNYNNLVWGNNNFILSGYSTIADNVFSIYRPAVFNINQSTLPYVVNTYSINYLNNMFFIYDFINSNNIYRSSDGLTWYQSTHTATNLYCSAYGNGIYVILPLNSYDYLTSTDGSNWTKRSLTINNVAWNDIVYGNNLFVAVGYWYYYFLTSSNGTTWNYVVVPIDKYVTIAYGNGIFVALTEGSSYITSSDGITWTQQSLNYSGVTWKLQFLYGTFIAIGYNTNMCITSTNGINWNLVNLPLTAKWKNIAYGKSIYIVVAESSNILAYSLDLIKWKTYTTDINRNWKGIAFGNNTFVVVANDSIDYMYFSPTLTLPSTFDIPTKNPTFGSTNYSKYYVYAV